MMPQTRPASQIGIAPLVGNQETDQAYALGTLLSMLLSRHLSEAGLPVVPAQAVARRLFEGGRELPLDADGIQEMKARLGLGALVHGRYTLDDEGKMLGLRLAIDAPEVPPMPLEASTPLAGFARFVEHIALALIERLELPIDDRLRQRVGAVARPASFEAFRQVAQAQAAWSRGQSELALAAITSALALDPDYEDAIAIEVAVARAASDTATVREAFRRWAAVAVKRARLLDGAQRLTLLGHWLNKRGEWTEARAAYEDARNLYRRRNDETGEARALNNLANLDLSEGRVQAAIKTYRRSLRAFESDPNARPDGAITLLNLALAHKSLGQREEALMAAEQALTVARGLKDPRLEGRILAQRGAIYDDMGEWSRSEADYGSAAQLLAAADDLAGLAMVKSHQALLFKQQGHYARAEALNLEALAAFERQANPHEQAVVWLNLADLYFAMRLYDQAWRYANQAHDVFFRLKSGLSEHARTLVEALEDLVSSEEEDAELFAPPASQAGAPPDEGLYNDSDLYDNEFENEDDDGSDGDLNSSEGRTPMM